MPGARPDASRALRDVAYVNPGHARQQLDLFIPPGATNPLPLIIWVHGGAWSGGSKEQCPALTHLKDGYAVASLNYRLSQHAIFPAQIEDCKAAIRWLRAHAQATWTERVRRVGRLMESGRPARHGRGREEARRGR
jgi:acetyl esterase/lipase